MSISGEHRLLACCRRQLADDSEASQELLVLIIEELFGRLPKRTGWQPVLPRNKRLSVIFGLYEPRSHTTFLRMTKFDLRRQDCITGMSRLADASVDLVVTSPPYNLGISYGKYSDRQDRRSYLGWCGEWAGQIRRVLKSNGSFFLNIGAAPSNPMLPHEIVMTLREFFVLQNTIHWIKSIAIDDHCSRRPAGDARRFSTRLRTRSAREAAKQFARLAISSRSIRRDFSTIATNMFFISRSPVASN